MSQATPQSNAKNVLAVFAAIRDKEQSQTCNSCGEMKPTLRKGRANLCLACTEQISKVRQHARENY